MFFVCRVPFLQVCLHLVYPLVRTSFVISRETATRLPSLTDCKHRTRCHRSLGYFWISLENILHQEGLEKGKDWECQHAEHQCPEQRVREGGPGAKGHSISAAVSCCLCFLHSVFILHIMDFKVRLEIIVNQRNET